MIRGQINFAGKTLGDVIAAIEAAGASIEAENHTGFDRNEDGAYAFTLVGEGDAFGDEDWPRVEVPEVAQTREVRDGTPTG